MTELENIEDGSLFTMPVGDFTPEELSENSITPMDVTKKMFAIRRLRKEIERFEEQREQSNAFYADKIARLDKQIAFLEQNIWGYLSFANEEKVVTPAGTAFVTKREKWTWTEDRDKIFEWAKANAPDTISAKTKEDVDLSKLKEHIKQTQIVPQEIVTVGDESKINVRTTP